MSNPSRTHRGLPWFVWAAATFIVLFSLSYHYVERYERPALEKAMVAREAQRGRLGCANVSHAVRPLFRDLMPTRSTYAGKMQITPQDVERVLKPHGKVVWRSKTFPLSFVFIDPATRYEYTVNIDVSGSANGSGTGSMFARIDAMRYLAARRAQCRQLTSAAVWVTIIGLIAGVIAFRRPYRWLYEFIFIAAMITVAFRIATLTYGQSKLNVGLDEYPCLPIAAGVLWFAWAKRHARKPDPGRCINCDYDLTGNVSGVCPECGNAIPTEPIDVSRDEGDVKERKTT